MSTLFITLPVTATKIQQETRKDPVLSKVLTFVQSGWPADVPSELKPFKSRESELDLDKAIENIAQSCHSCQAMKAAPPAGPNTRWTRIHMDFAGPFQGHMFFIVVNAHSKWPEVMEMTTTTTANTLNALRELFSRHGLPEQMVSDNGPQFISEEFALFAKQNGIRHICYAPYHPSSNGLAERFVQTFKRAMKASKKDGGSLSHRLAEFLLTYRTAHATTGVSPYCSLKSVTAGGSLMS